jgi:hypothetical protein
LIAAVESMALAEITTLMVSEVTGLCA